MKKILVSYTFGLTLLVACSETNTELADQDVVSKKIECDSMFLIALEVIGQESMQRDSANSFSYIHRINDSVSKRVQIPFLSTFHDTLDVSSIWVSEGLDTLFTLDEIENYKKNEFQISTNCYNDFRFITKDTLQLWEQLYDNNQLNEMFLYASFSKPLISKDGRHVLIEYQETCKRNCGGAATIILEYSNGEWHKSKEIIRWVS